MGDSIPALTMGSVLIVGGGIALAAHRRSWERKRHEAENDDVDRLYYDRQYRRRSQATGIVVLMGVLILVGDLIIPWRQAPGLFAVYWIAVILLAFWVMLLAWADLVATRVHSRAAMNRIQQQQRELERQAAALRASRREGAAPR